MKKKGVDNEQLAFSYGKPLPLLLEEIYRSSRSPKIREEAERTKQALCALSRLQTAGVSRSAINQGSN